MVSQNFTQNNFFVKIQDKFIDWGIPAKRTNLNIFRMSVSFIKIQQN